MNPSGARPNQLTPFGIQAGVGHSPQSRPDLAPPGAGPRETRGPNGHTRSHTEPAGARTCPEQGEVGGMAEPKPRPLAEL